jgi:hypothetical protein
MSKRFPIDFTDPEHKALKRAAVESDMTMKAFIKVAVAEKIARLSAESKEASVLAEASEKPT